MPTWRIGLECSLQARDVHRSCELKDTPMDEHLTALAAVAEWKKLSRPHGVLRQRYPGRVS